MQTEDLLNLNVRNASGGMVPLSSFARVEWQKGPAQIVGYNGYPSVRISGQAAPGYSSGDAIAEMERLAAELPHGFGYEWTGQSLQEIQSGSQAPMLIALSILFVFLLLAALYESWSIPLSVMLVVPLGVIGSVLAVTLRGMPNDVYFKVGLIAIIGLSAKNAILIIEFAKDLRAEGKSLLEATVEAAQAALPADPDDVACLHPRRRAAGDRHGRQRRQPERHRHRRAGRHDLGDRAGRLLRAGVLRVRHEGVRSDVKAGRAGCSGVS